MNNFQRIRDVLAPIPDERWTTGAYSDLQGRCCAIGLLAEAAGIPVVHDGAECLDLLSVAQQYGFPSIYAMTRDCGLVNPNDDVHQVEYPGETPKERVLAYLDTQIKALS